ncbi:hypothetical protein EHZ19_29650 [Paraburkholderia bannensis]|jgi:hypothetical protein|uniref:Uncharacterized protein n=1 Tax=Paraburkholderia tropica TaxID=92647 RepID=A0AAQ1JW62_9BURK|nr:MULTISPECIES: hypothetical protein [Paraburkholderia]RQM44266.1 hypothetical protein EHZ19_29650 [Paraburkholderia bannensis]RQN34144.1 hypothetical protein EHZ25_36060 [Paraburkholderia tropica]SEK04052.1 hypothetical protein SAMN05216550_1146 [Paraburkholderia tropica]
MRDDLHTTVALKSHWRKAVRAVGRFEAAGESEAAQAIHHATCNEWESGVRGPWFAELTEQFERAGKDLFRVDSLLAVVDDFERRAKTTLEQSACEAARLLIYGGPIDRLHEAVRATVLSDCAVQGIEHCALSVAGQFGELQSTMLRKAMTRLVDDIDFSRDPAPKVKRKLDKDAMLGFDLSLNA